jgi:hypothetical protein
MRKHIYMIVFCVIFSLPLAAESLYVFVPTEVRANVMQEKIGSFCSGVEVTVFGRAKDFHKKVKSDSPSAILSLMPVIKHVETYKPVLNGSKNGAETEDYVLITVDKEVDIAATAGKKIGVVDLLGRKPMSTFIEQLFKAKVKLKRVTKVEDLLPLITFGSVEGIFIADSLYTQLKSKSNLNLVATKPNIQIGLVSAAINATAGKKVTECITGFDNELNTTLGVDKWRAL